VEGATDAIVKEADEQNKNWEVQLDYFLTQIPGKPVQKTNPRLLYDRRHPLVNQADLVVRR